MFFDFRKAHFAADSANCLATTAYDYGTRQLNSASSQHTGGVNAALADGSVQFISETIDCGTLTSTTVP
ncbi:MAG: DUF1559 domain-containing protein, partial [Planctomycetaceae bacterium]|nr:DUF1559 domain-containing protein [Planctomycetaceae bacterium]